MAGKVDLHSLGDVAEAARAGLLSATPGAFVVAASGDTTGATDVTNIQNAINSAANAGGGRVQLGSGTYYLNAQIKVYPNVSLVGHGNGYTQSSIPYGTVLVSSYVGSAILVLNDSRASTFVHLSHFSIYGTDNAAQNCIEINDTGGAAVLDTLIEAVYMFHSGNGLLLNSLSSKIIMTSCWIEYMQNYAVVDNRITSGGHLFVSDCLIRSCVGVYDGVTGASAFTNISFVNCDCVTFTGVAFKPGNNTSYFSLIGGLVSTAAGGALVAGTSVAHIIVQGVLFQNNGTSSVAALTAINNSGAHSRLTVSGCSFIDTRTGGNNVTNFAALAAAAAAQAVFTGCTFDGAQGDAFTWTSRATNKIIIKGCLGYNDTKGSITNMFSAASRIGAIGSTATATASTDYVVEGTDLYLVVSGGTAVSMSVKDPQGNTLQSGLSTFAGVVPVGYKVNFGGFSGAPTVLASVV